MSLPRYLSYARTDFEWLGEVPAHWKVVSLRHLSECLDGIRIPLNAAERADRPGTVPYWGANCIMGYVDRALLDEDLVLLGEDGAPFFDRDRPVAFFSQGEVWPNNHIHVLRPKTGCLGPFLAHALNATDFASFIDGSTRDKLTQGAMNRIPIALPCIEEQHAIATFLDRETAKIDALIAEQEKLLALLAEKRQATISHAVTRGPDPNVSMKDSGLPWLGEVPAHCQVTPLKYLVSLRSGGTPSKENLDYWDGTVPWASAKDLKCEYLEDTSDHLTQLAIDSGAASLLPAGVILVVVRGMILARAFPVVETRVPMAINQDLKALLPNQGMHAPYLAWLLRGTAAESLQRLDEAGHGTKALRMDAWTSLALPVPPEDEQREIVAALLANTKAIDDLVAESTEVIDLLKERRSALVSAAVTGKIDVRDQ